MGYLDETGLAALWEDIETVSEKPDATTSANGLMSAADKAKLDGIEQGANAYVLPEMTDSTLGGAKLGDGLRMRDGALGLEEMVGEGTDVRGPISSLTAQGWATQDGTPTPDAPVEIKVARGRNLLDISAYEAGRAYDANGAYVTSGVDNWCVVYVPCKAGQRYTVSGLKTYATGTKSFVQVATKGATGEVLATRTSGKTLYGVTPTIDGYLGLSLVWSSGASQGSEIEQVQVQEGDNADSYVPYGHAGIEVHHGANLVPNDLSLWTQTRTFNGNTYKTFPIKVENGKSYRYETSARIDFGLAWCDDLSDNSSITVIIWLNNYMHYNVTNTGNHKYLLAYTYTGTSQANMTARKPWVFENTDNYSGGVHRPYEPYRHDTIAVPLPSKGHAAALPDGTADTLAIDGAGKWEWNDVTRLKDSDFVASSLQPRDSDNTIAFAVNSGLRVPSGLCNVASVDGPDTAKIAFSTSMWLRFSQSVVGTDAASIQTWLNSNCVLLINKVTPTTESGYIDLPNIPSDATVTCPELDALGVRYFIGNEVSTLAAQWHDRIAYERTIATQDALASVAPIEHNPAESNHSVGELITYDGALYKVNAAIARGESIGTNATLTSVAQEIAALQ